MAEFEFPGLGLLIDQLKRPDGSWFFERGRPNADGTEKSAFQKQHVTPKEDMTGNGRDFIDRISSSEVDSRYRFNGGDFSLNGSALPVSDADAVRLGSSVHRPVARQKQHDACQPDLVGRISEVMSNNALGTDLGFAKNGSVNHGKRPM